MAELTHAGLVVERLSDIVVRLDQGFKQIYGNDINTDPDSPDGQMIGLIGQMRADVEELAEAIYRALDPDHASGAWLEQRAAYTGLIRKGAQYSYLNNVRLSGTPGSAIAAGGIVEDEKKQRWLLVTATAVNQSGEVLADFRSEYMGVFTTPASAGLEIITKTIGWLSATTTEQALAGTEEETDPDFRARFYKSRARGAQSSVDGIRANILQLDDVRECICLENNTDIADVYGVPPHAINVIVDGGSHQEIAKVILERKTAGTGMLGETTVTVVDDAGKHRLIRFDRPAVVRCHAKVTLKRNALYTNIDTDAVVQAIAATEFEIGQGVLLTRLYSPINTVQGFYVTELLIGRDVTGLVAGNIDIGVREKARFAIADIEVIVDEL